MAPAGVRYQQIGKSQRSQSTRSQIASDLLSDLEDQSTETACVVNKPPDI